MSPSGNEGIHEDPSFISWPNGAIKSGLALTFWRCVVFSALVSCDFSLFLLTALRWLVFFVFLAELKSLLCDIYMNISGFLSIIEAVA